MKEELEKLGFVLSEYDMYEFILEDDRVIRVHNSDGSVYVKCYDDESAFMFDYDLEKLKQLIKLLS